MQGSIIARADSQLGVSSPLYNMKVLKITDQEEGEPRLIETGESIIAMHIGDHHVPWHHTAVCHIDAEGRWFFAASGKS